MDEKDIKQNIENFMNTIEFLSMKEKVEIVYAIQNSVKNWNQEIINEAKRHFGGLGD